MKNLESDIASFLEEWIQYAKALKIYCDAEQALTRKDTDAFGY